MALDERDLWIDERRAGFNQPHITVTHIPTKLSAAAFAVAGVWATRRMLIAKLSERVEADENWQWARLLDKAPLATYRREQREKELEKEAWDTFMGQIDRGLWG